MYSELNEKYRKIQVTESLYSTLLKMMWVVGGITVVGDFITWSLWSDYELNSSIDLRMTIVWVGCGWMAVCGLAGIIAMIMNQATVRRTAKLQEGVSPECIDWESVLQPVNTHLCWKIGIGVSLLILLVGNFLCWQAVPVTQEGREAILSYVQECMPEKEMEIVKDSGHSYVLEISGSTEHSFESLSIEYMQNEDLLDQENFSLSLNFDSRHYDTQQIMDVVKDYINAIDSSVFADGDITYVSSEFGKMEEQVLARLATMEGLEDYEEQVEFAREGDDTIVHFGVEDSLIESYDGTKYKLIYIRIHAINFRWDI